MAPLIQKYLRRLLTVCCGLHLTGPSAARPSLYSGRSRALSSSQRTTIIIPVLLRNTAALLGRILASPQHWNIRHLFSRNDILALPKRQPQNPPEAGKEDSEKKGSDEDLKDKETRNGEHAKRANPAVRAFCVFAFSAGYHALTNLVVHGRSNIWGEVRFFMINFGFCYIETVVGKARMGMGGGKRGARDPSRWEKVLGYLWVYGVFFVICPAWQWAISWEEFKWLLEQKGIPTHRLGGR